MGQLDDTIVIFTTDNGLKRSVILRQGQASQDRKGGACEGAYRAPCCHLLARGIKAGYGF
jgi:arylsulfatase A-like enzyme